MVLQTAGRREPDFKLAVPAGAGFYQLRLDLKPGAATGVVFDGAGRRARGSSGRCETGQGRTWRSPPTSRSAGWRWTDSGRPGAEVQRLQEAISLPLRARLDLVDGHVQP